MRIRGGDAQEERSSGERWGFKEQMPSDRSLILVKLVGLDISPRSIDLTRSHWRPLLCNSVSNKSSCKTFHIKMSNKPVSRTRFPTSDFARRLFLTQRQTATWKWSIEREGLGEGLQTRQLYIWVKRKSFCRMMCVAHEKVYDVPQNSFNNK